MRTHVFVLATATMLASFGAHAQQRAPASQADAPSASSPAITSAPVAHEVRAPRSLMGMVMGALIESAEQSARQARASSQDRNVTRTAADDLTLPAPSSERVNREAVAVQPSP